MVAPTITEAAGMTFPQASLPVGAKVGDQITLVVESLDNVEKTARLGFPKGVADPEATALAEPALPSGNDTDVLLGPMKGLKSYLVRKSQDKSRADAP